MTPVERTMKDLNQHHGQSSTGWDIQNPFTHDGKESIMAGKMSTVDFELIKDSINEAIIEFVKHYAERGNQDRPTVSPTPSTTWVNIALRQQLAKSFASRLKYTNDNFDSSRFKQEIVEP